MGGGITSEEDEDDALEQHAHLRWLKTRQEEV